MHHTRSRLHQPQGLTRKTEHAAQIDPEKAVEFSIIGQMHGLGTAYARVIDQRIEPTEALTRQGHRARRRAIVCDIHHLPRHPLRSQRRQTLQAFGLTVQGHQGTTRLQKPLRNGAADALCRPRHHDNLARVHEIDSRVHDNPLYTVRPGRIRMKLPTYFISHGGGPWPWVESLRSLFARTERELTALPGRWPSRPRAVLMVSGHWESQTFTVSSADHPGMEYDYHGFPAHTYEIRYPAPGDPALAARVLSLLTQAGLDGRSDEQRGLDHGVFVPMHCMYPGADMPVVMLSLKQGYDPLEHFQAGQALAPLREEGVLIMGSGLTYHDMRGFGTRAATPIARDFEQFLADAVGQSDPTQRRDSLLNWASGPQARRAHPREDHLIPLLVAAGATAQEAGRRLFLDHALEVDMGSYEFGGTPPAA